MATVTKESGQAKGKLPESMSFSAFGGINREKRAEKSGNRLEAADMVNFRLDAAGTLVKRSGYSKLCEVTGNIRGAWQGNIGGVELLLFATEGDFYRMVRGGEVEKIGTLRTSRSDKVDFFPYRGVVYLNDGVDFYICDGSTLSLVAGYVPLVKVHCTNNGKSEDYEDENLLTRRVRILLNIRSGVRTYRFPHSSITQVFSVKMGGRVLTLGSDYTIDFSYRPYVYLDLVNEPTSDLDNGCEVEYQLPDGGERAMLCGCRRSLLYQGVSLSAVMLYDGAAGRTVYLSKSDETGEARPDYFALDDRFEMIAGSGNVTALIQQYERILLFCQRSAWNLTLENQTDSLGFRHTRVTPALLNGSLGCLAPGCAVQLENEPVSLADDGVYRWVSAYVSSEKNTRKLSDRVGLLPAVGANTTVYVNRADSELYVSFGDVIYVYQYRLDAWYRFEGLGAVGMFDCYGQAGFFKGGAICLLDGSGSDAGRAISARFEGLPFEPTPIGAVKNLYRVILSTLPPEGDQICFKLSADGRPAVDFEIEGGGHPTWVSGRCRIKHMKSCVVTVSAVGVGGAVVAGFGLQYGIGGDR